MAGRIGRWNSGHADQRRAASSSGSLPSSSGATADPSAPARAEAQRGERSPPPSDSGALRARRPRALLMKDVDRPPAGTRSENVAELVKGLTEKGNHPLILVAREQATNARRELLRLLEEAGHRCVHANGPQLLRDQEHQIELDGSGQPRLIDGPFRQLLASGGTLLLELAGSADQAHPGFSAEQLEALNTLMEEQLWDGAPIACRGHGAHVNVAFIAEDATDLITVVSGALASRVTLFDRLAAEGWPQRPDPPVLPAQAHPPDVLIVDLGDDLEGWRHTLFGGLTLNDDQSWSMHPGALPVGFDSGKSKLVLRNPPADPRLMDWVVQRLAAHETVVLETGLPPDEARERLQRKRRATDFARVESRDPDAVCVLSTANINEVLTGGYRLRNGALARAPSQLSLAQRRAADGLPRVLVGEPLPQREWDRLMQHPVALAVAAAPGVDVPARYTDHVEQLPAATIAAIPDLRHLALPETWPAAVNFLHSEDPTLLDAVMPRGAKFIDVTPSTRIDELLYSLNRSPRGETGAAGQRTPGLEVREHLLVEALSSGETAVLRGLEVNTELTRDLAPLLHPPHRLVVNGIPGPFMGKLIVVTPDLALIRRHGLTHAVSDPAPPGRKWEQAVKWRLRAVDKLTASTVAIYAAKALELYTFVRSAGVADKQSPVASYGEIKRLTALLAQSAATREPGQRRILRSLVKDMLVGEMRRTDIAKDARYEMMKACLKTKLPDYLADEADAAWYRVSLERLNGLLALVHHPKDVHALRWSFINAFSRDVVDEVLGLDAERAVLPDQQERIGQEVIQLLQAQAVVPGLEFPDWLSNLPGPSNPYRACTPVDRQGTLLQRSGKLEAKLEVAMRATAGIFLKGPPGTGKTHLVQKLTEDGPVVWAPIAEEGSAAFAEKLIEWASGERGTLAIDEANLAKPGNLDMLKGLFADRSLHVNGKRYPLGQGHRIIFTGNSDNLPGRSSQPVAQQFFATVQVKSMTQSFLASSFVAPIVGKALAEDLKPTPGEQPSERARALGAAALEAHDVLARAFPDAGFTPRDLEELLSRALSRLRTIGTQGPPDAAVVASAALEVYGCCLPTVSMPAVRSWLQGKSGLAADAPLPPLFDEASVRAALELAGLAPTGSTVALAGAVDGWLQSQAARELFNPKRGETLGKRALLIEGPASRGKDAVVAAVLEAHKEKLGTDWIHINADPSNLEGLQTAIQAARQRGQVVLVSELNLLPSGILEGELNSLLTGQADAGCQPGFALVATINPGYAGRKEFSAALRNRMHTVKVPDYVPEELPPIAQALFAREQASMRAAGTQASEGVVQPAQQKVQRLVELHRDLLDRFGHRAAEFQPGIRQLRNSLTQLAKNPALEPERVFKRQYGLYIRLVGTAGVRLASRTTPSVDGARAQLAAAFSLSHPGSPHPGWNSDESLPQGDALAYDAQTHTISFNPRLSAQALVSLLLDKARSGTLFVARPAPTAPHAPVLKPAATGPVAVDPRTVGESGVGTASRHDAIGNVRNLRADQSLLAVVRLDFNGNPLPFKRLDVLNRAKGSPNAPSIELNRTLATEEGRLYLPVPAGHIPTGLEIGGLAPDKIYRDDLGGWYGLASQGRDSKLPLNVSYRLEPDSTSNESPAPVLQGFPDLSSHFKQDLREAIAAMQLSEDPWTTIEQLKQIFRSTLEYSDADAQALQTTRSAGDRCARFLTTGQGVCSEFATAFAAVLTQRFEISARLCEGYSAQTPSGAISAQPHLWVEVHVQDQWRTVDPTPPPRAPHSTVQQQEAAGAPDSIAESLSAYWRNAPRLGEVSNRLSLGQLGLSRSRIERGSLRFSPTTGTLDLKRAAAGLPDMFRRSALTTSVEPLALMIEGMPFEEGSSARLRLLAQLTKPLAALRERGVSISFLDAEGRSQPLNELRQLLHGRSLGLGADIPGKDDELRVGSKDDRFFAQLASQYYENLLRSRSVDLGSINDIKIHIIHELAEWQGPEFRSGEYDPRIDSLPLPFQCEISRRSVSVTKADAQGLVRATDDLLKALPEERLPAGSLAPEIERRSERFLSRIGMQLCFFQGDNRDHSSEESEKYLRAWADRVEHFLVNAQHISDSNLVEAWLSLDGDAFGEDPVTLIRKRMAHGAAGLSESVKRAMVTGIVDFIGADWVELDRAEAHDLLAILATHASQLPEETIGDLLLGLVRFKTELDEDGGDENTKLLIDALCTKLVSTVDSSSPRGRVKLIDALALFLINHRHFPEPLVVRAEARLHELSLGKLQVDVADSVWPLTTLLTCEPWSTDPSRARSIQVALDRIAKASVGR